jgi:adenylate cyclase
VRSGLRRFLRRRGAASAEIDNAARGGYLALLVLDREVLPGERKYSLIELAERGKTDPATARAIWRAIGFPDIPDDLPAFTEADVKTLRAFLETFRDPWVLGWSLDVALQQVRVVSSSMARAADAVTDDVARSFRAAREAGMSDEELADRIAPQVDFDAIQELIGHLFRLQLRSAFWRRLAGASPGGPGVVEGGVGFVDLVGYTALAEELEDEELATLLQRFGELAHDTVVASGGRIVKTIGDEVMFVTDTAMTAADIAVALTERTSTDDLLPLTRAGVAAGALVLREGDYFGPVVNLASRLTEIARPGTVLAPAEVGEVLGRDPRFAVRRISTKRIRDIGRVEVCVLARGIVDDAAAP